MGFTDVDLVTAFLAELMAEIHDDHNHEIRDHNHDHHHHGVQTNHHLMLASCLTVSSREKATAVVRAAGDIIMIHMLTPAQQIVLHV